MLRIDDITYIYISQKFYFSFKSPTQKKRNDYFQSVKYESNGAVGCCRCLRVGGKERELKAKIYII